MHAKILGLYKSLLDREKVHQPCPNCPAQEGSIWPVMCSVTAGQANG